MKIFSTLLFCLMMALTHTAYAQETDPAKLFETAETYYNVGDWELALKNYKEAYILSKEPALLYNMAQCYRQMNKYDEAIRTYKNFLKETPDTPLRSTVEGFIKDLEAKKAANPNPNPIPEPTTKPDLKPDPIVVNPPTSQALTPEKPEEPSSNKKLLLYGGIGGGVVLVAVIAGVAIASKPNEPNTTLGTFRPFPL